jgi:hypothetical protein
MKKTITTLSLLLAFLVSFASGDRPESGTANLKEPETAAVSATEGENPLQNCTVSQSAVVSAYGSKVSVTCTVTQATCSQAASEAVRCIREYTNQIKAIIR